MSKRHRRPLVGKQTLKSHSFIHSFIHSLHSILHIAIKTSVMTNVSLFRSVLYVIVCFFLCYNSVFSGDQVSLAQLAVTGINKIVD